MTRLLFAAVLVAALVPTTPAGADTTFTVTKTADVNDGGCLPGNCSLRDAVSAANATAGTDTISLPPGQFKLEGAAGEDANAGGDLDVTESLKVVGAGAGATTIDANHIDRAFDMRVNTATLSVTNLAFTGGVDGNAGVILTPGPALTLTGVLFKDNAAGGGGTAGFGLIHATAGGAFALTVDHTTFDSNTSGGGGGSGFGLMDIITGPNSTVKFSDVTFTSNHVGGGTNGSGFGLIDFNAGAGAAMTVTRAVMRGNTVGGGMNASGFGLIDQLTGSLDVVDSTVSDNQVGGGASGASGFGTIVFPSSGPLTVRGSTFSGNQVGGGGATAAGFGGAIDANGSGPVTIENSTFAGNTAGGGASDATGFGGALDLGSGTITLTNLTFVGNVAGGDSGTGGAISPSTPANVTSKNNVFSGNTAAGVANSCGAALGTSGGGNIDDTSSCGFTPPADLVGNPLLGSLGAFGGLSPTVPLLPGSPAIDRGAGCSATDQRGQPRTGARCDSGAYEFAPPSPTTGTASAIKSKGATLGGSLIPSLRAASFHFEYGKTTTYGSQTPAQTAGGSLSAVGVTAPISGLKPGTTYHFRL
ncbi:MAG TPA: choice-of-anchor Q domain-containing protein, partial [Thermoleophilaceae bacterium]